MKKKSKLKSKVAKAPVGRPARETPVAQNLTAAVNITRLPVEVIRAFKNAGSGAFKSSGRVDCVLLLSELAVYPEYIAEAFQAQKLDSIKSEREQVKLTSEQIDLEQKLGNIAPIDICRRILTRGGKLLLTKMLAIPDRTAEHFAISTDVMAIRERLLNEINDAAKSIKDEEVNKLIKCIVAEK